MRSNQRRPGTPASSDGPGGVVAPAADKLSAVRSALAEAPHLSDQHISREAGCSPATVRKLRRAMGLPDAT